MDITGWQDTVFIILRTLNQILAAGIAVTAFAMLLYALTFNLRDRVARTFAIILVCVVIVFAAEAIGSAAVEDWQIELGLRLQWVGIIILPATYFHFSDALLATTGKPSRGRRLMAARLTYLVAFIFLITLLTNTLLGPLITIEPPAPRLQPTPLTNVFVFFYVGIMILSWVNFRRAYKRTTTPTSRRRMMYLVVSAVAPALGCFPYLLYGANFAGGHTLVFWSIAVVSNFIVGGLIVVMSYGVAFFGVTWPDRVVKSRLMKWIMRGPITASFTLAFTTIVSRVGDSLGFSFAVLPPIVMVATILVFEYLITLFSPLWEEWLFFGKDRQELELLRKLENRLLVRNDLRQFLESLLSAISDRLQAEGAYVVALSEGQIDLIVQAGAADFEERTAQDAISQLTKRTEFLPNIFEWGTDHIVPVTSQIEDGEPVLLGVIGISGIDGRQLDDEQMMVLMTLAHRVTVVLQDWQTQQKVFRSLESLAPQVELIQQMRAAGIFDRSKLLDGEMPSASKSADLAQWVKDALGHYWGGPKLMDNQLYQLQVVQKALKEHDGNQANALRAILREAIDRVRPEGERRFTGEWLLYNILELKFLEGRKVRDVALRLAMSEADLYRKQRVAIDAVAKAIQEMESQVLISTEEG
jgi:hypothetical protein